jgi:hypothetical protein
MSKSEVVIRVLKSATTKSISGRSSLKYEFGSAADNTVYIRITNNSASGQFSPEWVKVDDILKALAKARKGDPLTSFLLEPLLRGRSVNTHAFIMAALTNEGLLRVLKGKKRGHELLDPEGFDAKMRKLVSAPVKIGGKMTGMTAGTTARKAQIKKKAAVRKKQ